MPWGKYVPPTEEQRRNYQALTDEQRALIVDRKLKGARPSALAEEYRIHIGQLTSLLKSGGLYTVGKKGKSKAILTTELERLRAEMQAKELELARFNITFERIDDTSVIIHGFTNYAEFRQLNGMAMFTEWALKN